MSTVTVPLNTTQKGQPQQRASREPGKPPSTSTETLAGWRGLSTSQIQVYTAAHRLDRGVNTGLKQTLSRKRAATVK